MIITDDDDDDYYYHLLLFIRISPARLPPQVVVATAKPATNAEDAEKLYNVLYI